MTYLHGYTEDEATRLRAQAKQLAPYILFDAPLRGAVHILEVGSGVGGQTTLLAKLYPEARITALEKEASSHEAAQQWLRSESTLSPRVTQLHADATSLPDSGLAHDAAYVSWVLEHCPDPRAVVRGMKKWLAPGARVLIHEVFNQSLDIRPHFPASVRRYADAYNKLQVDYGGDPNVGATLGQLLFDTGFEAIETSALLIQLDDRVPEERASMFDYMGELYRSGESGLMEAGLVTREDGELAARELSVLGRTPGVSFHYTVMRALARMPG